MTTAIPKRMSTSSVNNLNVSTMLPLIIIAYMMQVQANKQARDLPGIRSHMSLRLHCNLRLHEGQKDSTHLRLPYIATLDTECSLSSWKTRKQRIEKAKNTGA